MASKQGKPRISEPEHPFRHRLPVQVRFSDIDMLGHLNNSVYLQFFDLGKIAYFTAASPTPIDWKKVNVVVVNINCDFTAQARITEPLEVLTQVSSIGEKSFRLDQRVVNAATGEVKCAGRTVMAGFDIATGASAPIAAEWIDAFNAYEGRELRSGI
ncbi:MAG: acyl-CoA thioesterase [Muribaculaceae bacterium]|nr:acyl-CoA thioesterase [Muribaculaceae bacterium]